MNENVNKERRRSSQRIRLVSAKNYVESDDDDTAIDKTRTKPVLSCSSSRIHFKWSLQSQMLTEQLRKLFFEHETKTSTRDGGRPLLTTDVTLVSCEGDSVQAHKIILVLCCPYFWRLFSKEDISNKVVVMGNLSTTSLKNLVRFIYTGVVDVAVGEEKDFLKTAQFLGIVGVQKEVSDNSGLSQNASVSFSSTASQRYSSNPTQSSSRTEDTFSKLEPTASISGRTIRGCDDGDNSSLSVNDPNNKEDDGDAFSVNNDWEGDESNASFPEMSKDDEMIEAEKGKSPYGPNKDLWIEINSLTEEEVSEDWRKYSHFKGLQDYESLLYYCYHGGSRKCGARIKVIKEDGVTTFYTNQVPHSNHRGVTYGLPPETKRFIVSLMEQGIRRYDKIISAMQLLSMDLPTKRQITCFVNYTIRKSDQVFPFPKQPKIHPPGARAAKAKAMHKKLGRPRTGLHPRLNIRGLPGVPVGSVKQKKEAEKQGCRNSPQTQVRHQDNDAAAQIVNVDKDHEQRVSSTISRHFNRLPPTSTDTSHDDNGEANLSTHSLYRFGAVNQAPPGISMSSYAQSSLQESQSYPFY